LNFRKASLSIGGWDQEVPAFAGMTVSSLGWRCFGWDDGVLAGMTVSWLGWRCLRWDGGAVIN